MCIRDRCSCIDISFRERVLRHKGVLARNISSRGIEDEVAIVLKGVYFEV